MPVGMRYRQLCMGMPKMRNGVPCALRCAASDSPYGPAPMIATSMRLLAATGLTLDMFPAKGPLFSVLEYPAISKIPFPLVIHNYGLIDCAKVRSCAKARHEPY